jgi:hypothetical protein
MVKKMKRKNSYFNFVVTMWQKHDFVCCRNTAEQLSQTADRLENLQARVSVVYFVQKEND